MTDMTISAPGLIEIAEHEGIVPAPYVDSAGVWTWGIGHTAAAGAPDPARMHRAMPQDIDAAVMAAIYQFAIDVQGYVARVNDALRVPVAQRQFDALVSFDFNTGGIHRAKLTAAINAGDPDAARHFMGWLRPPEIRKRRTAEMALFRTGDYTANGDAVPIWRTDGRGTCPGQRRHRGNGRGLDCRRPVRAPQRRVGADPRRADRPGAGHRRPAPRHANLLIPRRTAR